MLAVRTDGERVQIGKRFSVSFQRTLRVPDDGKTYPLPPGLGRFPVLKAEPYGLPNPQGWERALGVLIPLYQREALWLGFEAAEWKPNALQVGVGGINALTGEPLEAALRPDPQNYLVCPDQPWLDGIVSGEGSVRQFVAVPLGRGYTVGEQLGSSTGGLQLRLYEPKPGVFPDRPPRQRYSLEEGVPLASGLGLGAGGQMRQKVYPDPYGLEVWDGGNSGAVFVHIVNSAQFQALTGQAPPPSPISARTYTQYGFPWFDLYDEHQGTLKAGSRLRGVRSVREVAEGKGVKTQEEGLEIRPEQVRKLRHGRPPPKTGKTRR